MSTRRLKTGSKTCMSCLPLRTMLSKHYGMGKSEDSFWQATGISVGDAHSIVRRCICKGRLCVDTYSFLHRKGLILEKTEKDWI